MEYYLIVGLLLSVCFCVIKWYVFKAPPSKKQWLLHITKQTKRFLDLIKGVMRVFKPPQNENVMNDSNSTVTTSTMTTQINAPVENIDINGMTNITNNYYINIYKNK
jgi:hypothetical protein